jgi:hypothetical protein
MLKDRNISMDYNLKYALINKKQILEFTVIREKNEKKPYSWARTPSPSAYALPPSFPRPLPI